MCSYWISNAPTNNNFSEPIEEHFWWLRKQSFWRRKTNVEVDKRPKVANCDFRSEKIQHFFKTSRETFVVSLVNRQAMILKKKSNRRTDTFWSEKITWSSGSGELNTRSSPGSSWTVWICSKF
jgi:hypothetical protein